MSARKIFISHATADKPLIEAFVELLESGMGVPHDQVFCTSLTGQGIPPGKDFKETIRTHLDEATCVIALITPNYYGSPFCMCELGGTWLQAKDFLPVLVPPLDYSNLEAVLQGIQVLKLQDKDKLDYLRDEINRITGLVTIGTPRWNSKSEKFLNGLDGVLASISNRQPIPRAQYEKLEHELKEYKEEFEAAEVQIEELRRMNSELMKAKDAKAVMQVIQSNLPAKEQFDALTKAAVKVLKALPRSVRETLYYRARKQDYVPENPEAWEDVKQGLENGYLQHNLTDSGVRIKEGTGVVNRAMQALDALSDWLSKAPPEFYDWYAEAHDGEEPDMTLRTFWKRELLS